MNPKRIVAGIVGFLSLVLLAAACASEAPDPMVEVASDAAYLLEGVRVWGDYGWIDSHCEKAGVPIGIGNVEQSDPVYVWRDGGWMLYVSPRELARDNPCSLDVTAEEPAAAPAPTPTATSLGRGVD